jgi:flagellar motility protein MotE (MotC chaperone)
MANVTKDTKPKGIGNQAQKSQGSADKKGSKVGGIITAILALLTALLIMVAIFGGAFYFIIKNNVNGIADRYSKQLNSNVLTKWMMPPIADPYDPSKFTEDQLKSKYNELRRLNSELKSKIETNNKQLSELSKSKTEAASLKQEILTTKSKAKAATDAAAIKQKDLTEQEKKLNEMIANGDKEGFKTYFEKVDSETAKNIYTQIMKEEKIKEDTLKYVKLYETMDSATAAVLFEGLGTAKINLIAEILKNMKSTQATNIIAAMTPKFAGAITERLATVYGIKIPSK